MSERLAFALAGQPRKGPAPVGPIGGVVLLQKARQVDFGPVFGKSWRWQAAVGGGPCRRGAPRLEGEQAGNHHSGGAKQTLMYLNCKTFYAGFSNKSDARVDKNCCVHKKEGNVLNVFFIRNKKIFF